VYSRFRVSKIPVAMKTTSVPGLQQALPSCYITDILAMLQLKTDCEPMALLISLRCKDCTRHFNKRNVV